tara:strand:- start:1716 stop:1934 length:219 start_codon:yes stop_codon:yes gene_type:complete
MTDDIMKLNFTIPDNATYSYDPEDAKEKIGITWSVVNSDGETEISFIRKDSEKWNYVMEEVAAGRTTVAEPE